MKKLLIRWVVLVISLVIAAVLTNLVFKNGIKFDFTLSGILMLFVGVAALSFLNATLGTILKLLTIPLSCLTLGLFSLVINAALFYAAGTLHLGFSVDGFLSAFLGSLLYSAASGVLGAFVRDEE